MTPLVCALLGEGFGVWVVGGGFPAKNEGEGEGWEGEGWGGRQAKEPASPCACICQNYPLAIYLLVSYRFPPLVAPYCAIPQDYLSLSPKAGHNKAGRSDFRNQRFEPDTGKMRKMRTAPLTLQKQGSEETPQNENAETAENADMKTRKISRKARYQGVSRTGPLSFPPENVES